MNPNQALWEKGDFTRIAALMRASGRQVAHSLGEVAGRQVLDLGCGDGTTAFPLAERGAEVLGVDIARNLVAAGQRRVEAEGLTGLRFVEGDACALDDIEDDAFDLSLSMFGAMFAPRPLDVAQELVRVTRRGGRIVMGNWIPDDPTSFISQLLKRCGRELPAPAPESFTPVSWGVRTQVQGRFQAAGVAATQIRMTRDSYEFADPARSPAEVVGLFREYYGPTMNAFAAATPRGGAGDLYADLVELAEAHNLDAQGGTRIRASYLRVEVEV